MWVGRRFFCCVTHTAHTFGPQPMTSCPSPSLGHRDSRPGSVFLFISFDSIWSHWHPHTSTHSAHSQSLETSIIKCEDYCRRLSAGLGPLRITLATTGIYNYNTLFWSSTSFPLLLSLLLRIPRVRCLRQACLWIQGNQRRSTQNGERGTSVRRRESRMTSRVPSLHFDPWARLATTLRCRGRTI